MAEKIFNIATYQRGGNTTVDADWVTDYTFEFFPEMSQIATVAVVGETGITASAGTIVGKTRVVVRVGSNAPAPNQPYKLTVTATGTNGEVRDMETNFTFN